MEEAKVRWLQMTDREQQVALRLVAGKTNREIAAELGITVKTYDKHRQNALKRTGCHNPVALVWLALQAGVVSL